MKNLHPLVGLLLAACGDPVPTNPDLRAVALEVSQAIQTPHNDVLLVAGKRTFVRFYVTREKIDHVDPPFVSASLEGLRAGTSLGVLSPLNDGGLAAITGDYLRENLGDSLNFELPASWIQAGDISLRAVVDPAQTFQEADRANNVLELGPVTFLSGKKLKVHFVLYSYLRGGVRVGPTQRDLDEIVSTVQRMFPIPAVDVQRTIVLGNCADPSNLSVPCDTWVDGPTKTPWREDIRDIVMGIRQTNEPNNLDALYFGLYALPRDVLDVTARGTVWWRDRVGVMWTHPGMSLPRDELTILGRSGAHEIGHLLGRPHVSCRGNEDYPDPNYPSPGGKIGYGNAFGIDSGDTTLDPSYTLRVLHGNYWNDVMTYCDDKWISAYTYTGIYNYIQTTRGVSSPP